MAAIDTEQRHDGHPSVRVDNLTAKASGLVQKVSLKPSTRYRLSGWIKAVKIVKANGETNGDIGAGLGVILWFEHSNWVSDTKDWVYASMDFTTNRDTDLKVGPWLGHYGKQVTGTAWFADLSLIELGSGPVEPKREARLRAGQSCHSRFLDGWRITDGNCGNRQNLSQ